MSLENLEKEMQAEVAVQATGCPGAGDYLKWAREQGYPYCEVLNWSSSAGDWQFIVSKTNGPDSLWYLMWQENNYPRPGFSRGIETDYWFLGSKDEALEFYGAWEG